MVVTNSEEEVEIQDTRLRQMTVGRRGLYRTEFKVIVHTM